MKIGSMPDLTHETLPNWRQRCKGQKGLVMLQGQGLLKRAWQDKDSPDQYAFQGMHSKQGRHGLTCWCLVLNDSCTWPVVHVPEIFTWELQAQGVPSRQYLGQRCLAEASEGSLGAAHGPSSSHAHVQQRPAGGCTIIQMHSIKTGLLHTAARLFIV